MQWEGNLRKLETSAQANEHGQVAYSLRGADVLQALPPEEITRGWGSGFRSISGAKFIAACLDRFSEKPTERECRTKRGRSIRQQWKAYCVPELSRIHEGIALRDFEWEQAPQPAPLRLHQPDGRIQGGGDPDHQSAIPLARPRRCGCGCDRGNAVPSVGWRGGGRLKEILSDKTNFRKMLANVEVDIPALEDWKEECRALGRGLRAVFPR